MRFRPSRNALWALALACISFARAHPATLERRVMTGYQGWFRAPGDGSGMGWAHYERRAEGPFTASGLGVDYWPDVSELSPAERHPTPLAGPDGKPAELFSSHNPRTVARHFQWMREYGIDGAFVQRFAAPIAFDDARSRLRRRAADDVLGYERDGAERAGRSFALMYDLSGLPAGAMARVMSDWRHLVDDLRIRESPAYQYHRGRPVVAVWGVGFGDRRAYTLREAAALIDFLKSDPRYGGNTVMLGIPTWWREGVEDATADPALPAVLLKADILSPWTPGRYSDVGGVRAQARRFWIPDKAWCAARGIDYMPVVFPGFSWRHLKGADGGIGRADGRFLWEQYRQLVNGGFTMIYQAMFDEMDEGTQIFKTAEDPPGEAGLESYRPLPSDHYLWIAGTAAGYLRHGEPMPERIVGRWWHGSVNRYLRSGDAAAYAAAGPSFEAQMDFFAIGDALASRNGGWAPAGADGSRVRASGAWDARYRQSADPGAAFEWEIAPVAAGETAVEIRCPADPFLEHALGARIAVEQGGATLAESEISLRDRPLAWHPVLRARLGAGAPCRIWLDRPAGTGALTVFEARLRPSEGP